MAKRINSHHYFFTVVVLSLSVAACTPQVEEFDINKQNQILGSELAAYVTQIYNESLLQCQTNAQLLLIAVDSLENNPVEANLSLAKTRWQNVMSMYGVLEPYLYLSAANSELLLPIQSAYITPENIDYTAADSLAGIVNNPIAFPDISLQALMQYSSSQNGVPMLGLHVAEFLLWGENTGRSISDFQPIDTVGDFNQTHAERRILYLKTVCENLSTTFNACKTLPDSNVDTDNIINSAYQFLNDTLVQKRLNPKADSTKGIHKYSNTGNTRLLANYQSLLALHSGTIKINTKTFSSNALLQALKDRNLQTYEDELPTFIRLEQSITTQIPTNFNAAFKPDNAILLALSDNTKSLSQLFLRISTHLGLL